MTARGVLIENGANRVGFWCPGCEEYHIVNIGPGSPTWAFNGDWDRPTLVPSVLVRSGHHVPGWSGKQCWCTYNKENPDDPAPYQCRICHSFVTAGEIQFLGDCTHALAGKTVRLTVAPPREAVSDE